MKGIPAFLSRLDGVRRLWLFLIFDLLYYML